MQTANARVSQRNSAEDTASVLSPELADAADILSDRLREQMQHLAGWAEPHTAGIDRTFLGRLRELGFEARQRNALAAITAGAAARLLRQGQPLVKFIEQVEYNGRRLAKLNLPPSAVLKALKEMTTCGSLRSSGQPPVAEAFNGCGNNSIFASR